MPDTLTPCKVMIRDENATGLDFQASLYRQDESYHDLIAEVYSLVRAQQIARLINAYPSLTDAIQMALDYILSETTRASGAGHSRSEVVQALLDALGKVEARE